jgi:hypothetical protein
MMAEVFMRPDECTPLSVLRPNEHLTGEPLAVDWLNAFRAGDAP